MKRTLIKGTAAMLCLSLLCSPALPVRAQDLGPSGFDAATNIMSGYMDSVLGSAAVGGAAENARGGRSAPPRTAMPAPAPASPRGPAVERLPYRASPAVTARLRREMAESMIRRSPGKAAEVREFVANADFTGEFDRDMARFGYSLRSGDVIDALAAYWVCLWAIANDRPQPPAAQVAAVRRQIARSAGGNPALARGGDEQRQLVGEPLVMETEMALNVRDYLQHQGKSTRSAADNAYRNLLAKGVDLRAMQLTEAGFARR